jgi:hypothetical protein
MRGRGSHIFYTTSSQMAVRLPALHTSHPLTPRNIPGTHFCQRLSQPQWPHQGSNPRPSGLQHSASTNYATAFPDMMYTDQIKPGITSFSPNPTLDHLHRTTTELKLWQSRKWVLWTSSLPFLSTHKRKSSGTLHYSALPFLDPTYVVTKTVFIISFPCQMVTKNFSNPRVLNTVLLKHFYHLFSG